LQRLALLDSRGRGAPHQSSCNGQEGRLEGEACRQAEGQGQEGAQGSGGANGEEPPAEKPVGCGDCGREFPTSREAADHMRDEPGSVEAAGSGGR
jgi:hypothetical protein